MIRFRLYFLTLLTLLSTQVSFGQRSSWHGITRALHYRPEGADFVKVQGTRRFNRALYGTNTAFRAEAGDLPEFALYMPGMGGNLKFGLIDGQQSKWLTAAQQISTRYRPGAMEYTIKDTLLGDGILHLTVMALADGEGIIVRTFFKGSRKDIRLVCTFGGATGRKFSRDGDIGADPESSFYLQPAYCADNIYSIHHHTFRLTYAKGAKALMGIFPSAATLTTRNAQQQETPGSLSATTAGSQPVLMAIHPLTPGEKLFFVIQRPDSLSPVDYKSLPDRFIQAAAAREALAGRVKVNTPDPYINTLGGALAVAADGIWEQPTYLHGAVAWRMRLNAWRGAYVADPLGWPERAALHFRSYVRSQVLEPETAPVVMDTLLHLARHQEKMGNALFSSGYISRNPNDNTRPHHYDMNLVFFDQLLTHFHYTGDRNFLREMWPAIKRHLAWEKRNFDKDGDGLYDAYAAIWASDALQYSGGGVTHSSAYNYRANKLAAQLAKLLGEDGTAYEQESRKIVQAINQQLWLPQYGWYAEYKDLYGSQLLHTSPGLWSIYHAIDADVPDAFRAYQALRYIDNEIPHIPVIADGLPHRDLYTLSTTNWQPYDWSLNNVALAEVLHTALAYWQGGRPEEAYKIWESILIETMYLSASPGGFEQLSFYDAMRGELYRDFADPIGMAARSLTEGLFGIRPDALHDTLTIKPGLPAAWKFAALQLPHISFDFKRKGNTDTYILQPSFGKQMHLRFQLPAYRDAIKSITINGRKAAWQQSGESVGLPWIEIAAGKYPRYEVRIEWEGVAPDTVREMIQLPGQPLQPTFHNARLLAMKDPQGTVVPDNGYRYHHSAYKTVFCKVRQGMLTWWLPVHVTLKAHVQIIAAHEQYTPGLVLQLKNNGAPVKGTLMMNKGATAYTEVVTLDTGLSKPIYIPAAHVASGSNLVRFEYAGGSSQQMIVNWTGKITPATVYEKVDLTPYFNDTVTHIFRNQYLHPRPEGPTLQLPWQGIGNWCYPLTDAVIDDTGLRVVAGSRHALFLPNGIALQTPGVPAKNIAFTSLWDNYPDSLRIPLTGKAAHAYLLMAGSTNPMQTRMDNGEVLFYYEDGTMDRLPLRNPETWWPIEQDYFTDDAAFYTSAPKPYRLYFRSGAISRTFNQFTQIKGFSNYAVEGGAGTILDIPLDPQKALREIRLKTLTNDVVIGLMSVTLVR
ncbi:DUF4450 domain-containing protein [Chitinophaga agri]|uniref:DUF4450 domain-containing protein n=1 Tax=Chitinophaga agri TaxID=2703787 RepID=A0A6B9ZED7_9BACT|nr:DUF4450 domain-containing protein [Chitinophaga agri]QHS59684.1 DUF4450 domain-containing protein [Chitinophaga agri]